MRKKTKREIEQAVENFELEDDDLPGGFMGLVAYVPPAEDDQADWEAQLADADYLLTGEGERIPRDTDVCAVLPYEFHPDVEAQP